MYLWKWIMNFHCTVTYFIVKVGYQGRVFVISVPDFDIN